MSFRRGEVVLADQQFIVRSLGQLSAVFLQKVNDCLKAALELP
jgi:hypothetical protein